MLTVTIVLSDEEQAAIELEIGARTRQPTMTVQDYIDGQVRQFTVIPIVDRYIRAQAAAREQKYLSLAKEDQTSVDTILAKAVTPKTVDTTVKIRTAENPTIAIEVSGPIIEGE